MNVWDYGIVVCRKAIRVQEAGIPQKDAALRLTEGLGPIAHHGINYLFGEFSEIWPSTLLIENESKNLNNYNWHKQRRHEEAPFAP